MKLIHHSKISETKCPAREFNCRGSDCAVFRWRDYWNTRRVYFEFDAPWWCLFRPFKGICMEAEAFAKWNPPEIEGWELAGKDEGWGYEQYAWYRQLNDDRQWYCGLQGER